MIWFNILNGLLSLASKLAEYLNNKQLMDAGEAKATLKALQEEKKRVQKAKDIRRRAHPAWIKRVRDKYNRK